MRASLTTAILLVAPMAMAATPIDGLYGSLFAGYAYLPDTIINTTNLPQQVRSDPSFRTSYDAGGSLGYKSTPIRYEIEATYINGELDRFNMNGIPQTGVGGYTNAVFGMGNIYYDIPELVASIQPYLGLGIGYGWVNTKMHSTGPQNATRYADSNTVFAYQGKAGLTYNFSESYAIDLGYRYLVTDKVAALGKRTFQAHLGNFGVVYRFDTTRYQ